MTYFPGRRKAPCCIPLPASTDRDAVAPTSRPAAPGTVSRLKTAFVQSAGSAGRRGNPLTGRGAVQSDTREPVRRQPTSTRAQSGAVLVGTDSRQGGNPRSQVVGGAPPHQPRLARSLTSSLLTSMFHTAIPPSDEQETSCLVS